MSRPYSYIGGRNSTPAVGGNFEVDENVIAVLPPGCQIVESIRYGTAAWTRAARISVVLEDGQPKSYFVKCATGDQGRGMMESEYISLKEIEKFMPSFIPKPLAWGEYKHAPVYTAFFLMDFLDIATGAPDPARFCALLAELHMKSQSPTGKFGFEVSTYQGPSGQNTEWHENWTFYFTRLLEQFFYREIANNGPEIGYEEEFEIFKKETIPQILDPLQADGRVLKPCLIHGNIWEDNTGTELHSNQPVIFDAGSHYGHHEFELGMWRRDAVRFGKAHTRQYLRFMPPSEPREQWDDRNRLYSIKYDLSHSIGVPGTRLSQRQLQVSYTPSQLDLTLTFLRIMDNMQYLNQKYKVNRDFSTAE